MVSYVEHKRLGPRTTGGCGCGGARIPVPINANQELEKRIAAITRETSNIQGNLTQLTQPAIPVNPIKTIPIEILPKKIEVPFGGSSQIQLTSKDEPKNDLRKQERYNFSRGISRENSYNKMNLPRKGCCGHNL